jgi:hypothetical protein
MNDILFEVMQSPGYSVGLSLTAEELQLFRDMIESQWLATINKEYPEYADQFKSIGVSRYHELAHLLDHNVVWNKANRCLPEADVQILKSQPFFSSLQEIFGDFKISDVVYDSTNVPGKEEIYWRLVRPNVATDVGPLHADKWFHELGQGGLSSSKPDFTIKVWIPIFCEPGKSGLMVVPDSHEKEWRHGSVLVKGRLKPTFEDIAEPILIETLPGDMLIFREETLHGGAVNLGEQTRVSAEITMVFPTPPQPKPVL